MHRAYRTQRTHMNTIVEEVLFEMADDMVEDQPSGYLAWDVPGMTSTYIQATLSDCLKKSPRVEGKSFGASSVSKSEVVLTQVELHLKAVGGGEEFELRNGDVEEMLKTAEGLAFRSRWA